MIYHYMDLTKLEKRTILSSPGPVIINGIMYQHRKLSKDLEEIYAVKDGERLPGSIGVNRSYYLEII